MKFAMMVIVTLAFAAACEPEPLDAAQETNGDLRAGLESQFRGYVRALLNQDVSSLKSILTEELKSRIREMGTMESFDENLRLFAEKESRKIRDELPDTENLEPDSVAEDFAIVDVVVHGKTVVSAEFTFSDVKLPNSLFFVEEDGSYRVNVQPPESGDYYLEQGSDNYTVYNRSSSNAAFYCGGAQFTKIAPPHSRLKYNCYNDACGWWYAGSSFRRCPTCYKVKCDWNWWGTDVYIEADGRLRCADSC